MRSMICGMENKDVLGRAGATSQTRRAFLSASAVTAVAAPLLKNDVQFGPRAIDKAGHRSPAAFPQVVA
jgi:hypothetical protein